MESGKTPRMEKLESGQQEMQEKIAQMTKIVTSLTKGKWITNSPNLQSEPTSWKDGIDPFTVPNQNDLCEQERLKKDPFERSKHVDMQQRCSLLDKKLKEIESVNDLGSVDPRELSWSLMSLYRPSSKCQNLKSTMEPNALKTIWLCIVTRWRGTPVMKIC